MPIRHWAELTTDEIRDRDMGRAIAVLPVAAIEQHGPHLPLATDAIIAEGYLGASRRCRPTISTSCSCRSRSSASPTSTRVFPGPCP